MMINNISFMALKIKLYLNGIYNDAVWKVIKHGMIQLETKKGQKLICPFLILV